VFEKILIANRGEIAIRVIRCLRDMGIDSVAVFSDADRRSLHVSWATEAVHLPGLTAAETYLDMDRIIEAAQRTGAQAIHPGYGFLSERAEFARRCEKEGLVFIGPHPESIDRMGDKTAARDIMSEAGVPIIPGYQAEDADYEQVLEAAREIGFPVMLKAAAGGGGKGMRLVQREPDLKSAYQQAKSEAKGAFNDDRVYLEKFLEAPRHIEVQIACDKHGHRIHLGERECTIQRRHQKVVEECPSPIVDAELRAEMGAIAVQAAEAVGYDSVGTVEFLMDRHRNYYFLEMNTRLQVEHCVTEWVTGLDLVRMQIEIAAGMPLTVRQSDVKMGGHSIECRIYAEDPAHQFRPSPGVITHLIAPSGNGVRDDSGVFQGYEVSIYYDPLISKLSTWGQTRAEAIARMKRALGEYKIGGIKSNLSFHLRLMRQPQFLEGDFDTSFIDRHPELMAQGDDARQIQVAIIAAAIKRFRDEAKLARRPAETQTVSAWKRSARLSGCGGSSWS